MGPNAIINATGTGDIQIDGTGGNGNSLNIGIYVTADGLIQVNEGIVRMNGVGGDGSGNDNMVLLIRDNSLINATGLGDVS